LTPINAQVALSDTPSTWAMRIVRSVDGPQPGNHAQCHSCAFPRTHLPTAERRKGRQVRVQYGPAHLAADGGNQHPAVRDRSQVFNEPALLIAFRVEDLNGHGGILVKGRAAHVAEGGREGVWGSSIPLNPPRCPCGQAPRD
jgi:hypothetical protein